MPTATTAKTRYDQQRPRRTPPHVALGDLRSAVGLTIDRVLDRLEEQTGKRYTRGAISAIENGHRGASADLLVQLAIAYGVRPGAIRTDYEPREWSGVA